MPTKAKLAAKSAPKKGVKKTAPKKGVKKIEKKVQKKGPKVELKVAPRAKPRELAPVEAKESFFERLLREKRDRHEQFQKQQANAHHHDQNKMPHNHASFSKFAGPRRRAS